MCAVRLYLISESCCGNRRNKEVLQCVRKTDAVYVLRNKIINLS